MIFVFNGAMIIVCYWLYRYRFLYKYEQLYAAMEVAHRCTRKMLKRPMKVRHRKTKGAPLIG